MRSKRLLINLGFALLLCGLLTLSVLWEDHYVLTSFALVTVSILYLLVRFEQRKVEARELVLLAVLAAIATVARIPFASIPSVQPTTFVIMISGFVFGAESGFMIGTVAALASNMILGQGPWTPWQMAAWGLVGYTAGLVRHATFVQHLWGRIIFGLFWGFLYGWILNLWGFFAVAQSGNNLSVKTIVTYFAGSALFDSFHAASNVAFLFLFSTSWMKSLKRLKRKYGLLE